MISAHDLYLSWHCQRDPNKSLLLNSSKHYLKNLAQSSRCKTPRLKICISFNHLNTFYPLTIYEIKLKQPQGNSPLARVRDKIVKLWMKLLRPTVVKRGCCFTFRFQDWEMKIRSPARGNIIV
ncbi:hypothetical protein Lal_00028636 [Lupinus albus]|nr:hypothetical protein Lal_00028636 [Lupinus albus]